MDELPVIEGFLPQEVAAMIATGEIEIEYEETETVIDTVGLILPPQFSSLAHLEDFEANLIWTPDREVDRSRQTTLILP
ncbi:hypothetical protein C7B65_15185 [Phormidesmis priestleyi ULC007]|uniref:Uncharacterized protein n=1 Tax=Phormidesmis priestleyi ULC007 TaxID=1920490 RepID=A0A2T1DD92_9CYAN|nr:hypothetical protein [Phormidesmis priestleyi]PSB18436.1 hypothetical protein C7B65_15185 [Phormidesmis priestleyi ULC007]PZO48837.1 MAG: hypothetical protein DCF14_16005 [Phormidesmis priestleyi]